MRAAGGHVTAWGDNSFGQSGDPGWSESAVAIAGGPYFTLAVLADGRVRGVGENSTGQATPPADLTDAVSVKAGGCFGLALRVTGTLTAWGLAPAIPEGLSNVIAIAAGMEHCLALRSDGTVVAWGQNGAGECSVPPGLDNAIGIAAGDGFSLALKAVGPVPLTYQWRFNGEDISGATNSVLVFSNPQPTTGGNYSVRVSNPNGRVTSPEAGIVVAGAPPWITQAPTNLLQHGPVG